MQVEPNGGGAMGSFLGAAAIARARSSSIELVARSNGDGNVVDEGSIRPEVPAASPEPPAPPADGSIDEPDGATGTPGGGSERLGIIVMIPFIHLKSIDIAFGAARAHPF